MSFPMKSGSVPAMASDSSSNNYSKYWTRHWNKRYLRTAMLVSACSSAQSDQKLYFPFTGQ